MYSPDIRLRCSARTNQGRVRQNNEDSIDLWVNQRLAIAIIADGMGGAVAGEEASRIAVETVRGDLLDGRRLEYLTEDDVAEMLEDSVQRANLNIVEQQQEMPELKGMGTTLTMAFARETQITLAHVGDSRAYHVINSDRAIRQITNDHSFVQALIEAGHITPDQAAHHPMKNVLYRALGQGYDIDVDIIRDVQVSIGDRLVLCSDGLTLHVEADEIAEIAMQEDDPHAASDKLINLALERGGKDNVSVIVMLIETDENPLEDTAKIHAIHADQETDDPTVPVTATSSDHQTQETPQIPLERPETTDKARYYGEGRDKFYEPHQ